MFNHFLQNNLPLILLFIWVLLLTSYVVFCVKFNDNEEEIKRLNKDVPLYGTTNELIYIKL